MTNYFSGVEHEDVSKVMDSFFDMDRIAVGERSCTHYISKLIRPRMLLKILVVATKSPGGVKQICAAWPLAEG